jgi:hypothetical protein
VVSLTGTPSAHDRDACKGCCIVHQGKAQPNVKGDRPKSDGQRRRRYAIPEDNDRACRVVLPACPEQSRRSCRAPMQRERPCGCLFVAGGTALDEIAAAKAETPQAESCQEGESDRLHHDQRRQREPSESTRQDALAPSSVGDVVEHCFRCSSPDGCRGIEGGDRAAVLADERSPSRPRPESGVEGVGWSGRRVDPREWRTRRDLDDERVETRRIRRWGERQALELGEAPLRLRCREEDHRICHVPNRPGVAGQVRRWRREPQCDLPV